MIGAVAIGLLLTTQFFSGRDDGPVTVWFKEPAAEVSDKLALKCADRNATVIEQDDRHVLCQREESGVAARYMFGSRGSNTPMLMVRFALLRDGAQVRVQATQYMETQTALGQTRRTELDGRKYQESMRELLRDAGGSIEPPLRADEVTPAPPPSQ